jgi:hypothetical protein
MWFFLSKFNLLLPPFPRKEEPPEAETDRLQQLPFSS